jgi:hypothetical protein
MANVELARLLRKTETWAKKLMRRWLRDPRLLGVILFGCIVGCSTDRHYGLGATLPPTKYKIDGSFDDWKTYETAKTDTGIDWSNVVITGYEGIHLKEFYYDNDNNYFYLFFKFKPTVQERWDKNHSSGDLGYLYIDTDANTNTGCSNVDADGTSTIPGAEIQIYFPIGFYMNEAGSGCYVACETKRWDAAIKSFAQTVRTEDSRENAPLIEHGKDGVEVAIPLADLGLVKGNEFAFTFWGDLVSKEYVKRTTFRLK